jgi:predicted nucleotidyltransferase
MNELLNNNRAALEGICSRFGVARLEVFGSALREDFKEGSSDLDFLVEFKSMEPYARVDAYFGLLGELRTMFQHDVDLVMADAVRNPYISREIDRTKQLLYAS